jgi:hypothetical protein
MPARGKGEMPVGLAHNVKKIRLTELAWVAIRGPYTQTEVRPGHQCDVANEALLHDETVAQF